MTTAIPQGAAVPQPDASIDGPAKPSTVGPCSDEKNGSAVAAPLQTVRMLTLEECNEAKAASREPGDIAIQREFIRVNGINPPAGDRGQA